MSSSKKEKHTLCAAPWKLLHLSPLGEVTSCFESSQKLGSLKHENLIDIWHGPSFQKLREQMIRGEEPEQCQKCFIKEKAIEGQSIRTLLNHRFDFNEKKALALGAQPQLRPAQLDLSFSNTCNLKCRMCGPIYSSAWVKELRGADLGAYEIYSLPQEKFNSQILPLLTPDVERVVLTGGEPFLDKKNEMLISNMAQKGLYQSVIEFNTNGTFISYELVKLLVKFESVQINFSLDDFGERFELLRKGAQWEQVQKNIRLWRRILPKAQMTSYSTISIFNAESFLDYVDEVTRTGLFDISEVALHYLNEPSFYSVRTLPQEKKQFLEQSYLKFMKKNLLISFDLKDCQNLILQMKMVLNYMKREPEKGARKRLLEECHKLDKIRGENVFELFPILREMKD